MVKERAVFHKKFIQEHEHYNYKLNDFREYREVLKDGNCFYLSIAVKFIEFFRKNENKEKWLSFKEKILNCFAEMKIESILYDDNLTTIEIMLNEEVDVEDYEKYIWFEVVQFLKFAISVEMKMNEEKYQPFLFDTTINEYCKKQVEPFFVEAGYIEIGVLVSVLPINIEVIDTTENSDEIRRIYGDNDDVISILHTPNHFEPIYL